MYEKVNPNLDFAAREEQVIDFWKENRIFEKSVDNRAGAPEFSFYDGPPTANGKPHIGHILTRTIKDIIPRYKTMKGYHVLRKAGWDTHGLPVELEVEKQLGMDGKQDIEKYGIEPFIAKCKESVWKYKGEWERMSERVGYWADMEHPYITYDDKYIESVWWALKTIYDKGLIYKGHKIVPYCPRCGTALSSHEVAQGYKDVTEKSAFVRFKTDFGYILAWTTTPWTLPSNVALCVNPESDYAYVSSDGTTYLLAADLVGAVLGEDAKIEKTVKGRALEGIRYEPLYTWAGAGDDAYRVVSDGYVTLTDGTGVVHIAPSFGEDDARVGQRFGLPFVQLVDDRGRFKDGCGEITGVFCKDADKWILKDLAGRGLLFKAPPFTHSYPFCWRCDTPLLYYARSTWFIRMTEVRDRLMKNNATVNWYPESIGKGRFGNFLENVIDWGLSRERYWGTPLPLWVCECGHVHAVGSKAELKELSGAGDIELHKPYVDQITFPCPKCGKPMHRTPEVIDCWFDSGSMPFAQYHYPFENKDLFDETFPADFISEAVDQTRGWFYTLMAISTLLFDRAPFKNCIVLGHVCDKDGVKMSKHKGNVVDPWSVLDKQGADAVRWYFYTASAPWLPSRFYPEAVVEAQRKYLGTLWNVYSFYVLYAEIDKFDPTRYALRDCKLSVMDRWALSALNTLVKTVDDNLAAYRITEAARAMTEFADKLSNWYVRRCRDRYWTSAMDDDKTAAFMTLYTVLETMARLTAPFTPFMAESIYRNIVCSVNTAAPESVHLTDFPVADEAYIDRALEADMDVAILAANLGRAARNAAAVKNRQPLGALYIAGTKTVSDDMLDIIAGELNVKKVSFVADGGGFVTHSVLPNLKAVGPKYGARVGAIRAHLAANGEAAAAAAAAGKPYEFEVQGGTVRLEPSDLLISSVNKPGYAAESEGGLTVILDTTITPELKKEGYAREIVSKVQNLRKESGFEVTDRIRLYYAGDAEIDAVFKALGGEIAADVLAESVDKADRGETYDINGKPVRLAVEKA